MPFKAVSLSKDNHYSYMSLKKCSMYAQMYTLILHKWDIKHIFLKLAFI